MREGHGGILETVEVYWRQWRYTGDSGGILETVEVYWRQWRYTGDSGGILETVEVYWRQDSFSVRPMGEIMALVSRQLS
jgi:hypothetical protein